ncbi:hypothetical protein CYMTET_5873 [Cymbomonas tetramitiformis]|uniref:Pentapeptide repeat-containing protein n=1 Tax=Cymbomonas tetramitiformis TaxID=36881 RepID=A0AAE0GYN6_9CHLO|nr:hypothetical protein CYMTET_5810 [Cymbomonas tetramitiformis]KAK3286647.1 hypothetical protein CYMTET_5873 [Cymbomonas tetramitiformis]
MTGEFDDKTSLEAALIAQEHRSIPVLINFYKFGLGRSVIGPGDPRSKASIEALFWRLFSPSNVTAVGISLVTVFTLFIAIEANKLIKDQNTKIDTQLFLEEANRRSALIFELTSILDHINAELTADESTWDDGKVREFQRTCPDEALSTNPNCPTRSISPRLRGRVAALSRSLRPYYYLSVDPERISYKPEASFEFSPELEATEVIERPLSPERAQLLISLIASGLSVHSNHNYNFTYADLEGINFRYANLEGVFLSGAQLNGTDFVHGDLKRATIMNATAIGAKFYRANLEGAVLLQTDFTRADLNEAKLSVASARNATFYMAEMRGAELAATNLHGADLRGVSGLVSEQLMKACINRETTLLPNGLNFDWDQYQLPRSCEKP